MQWYEVKLEILASFLINRKPDRLKTETQIGAGFLFSNEYQGVLLEVRNRLFISSLSPFCIYEHIFLSVEF